MLYIIVVNVLFSKTKQFIMGHSLQKWKENTKKRKNPIPKHKHHQRKKEKEKEKVYLWSWSLTLI